MTTHQFWQGKRVLITGHTGFKGSWLTLWLHRLGARVFGYAQTPPTTPSLFQLADIGQCVTTTTGDIRDLAHFTEVLTHVQPDVVFHLANQPLIRESYIRPIDTLQTNIMGTANVLEAIRSMPSVRAVVIATSDQCYENRDWLWGYREDDPMGGHDPFSCSKGAAELVIASYRRSFFDSTADTDAAIASVRDGHIIGGGDFSQDSIIPDFIRARAREQTLVIRNPHAIRPWQFVLEPLSGYITLAQRLFEEGQSYAEGWNFGPADNDTQTMSQMCAAFNHFLQKNDILPVEIELKTQRSALRDESLLRLDTSKARQRLDWTPQLELHGALELTAQWYVSYFHHDNLRDVCDSQIDFFQHLA